MSHKSEQTKSLSELEPDSFGAGSARFHSDVVVVPTHLSPQMALHWSAITTAASLAPDMVHDLIIRCVSLGGNPLSQDNIESIKAAKLPSIPQHLEGHQRHNVVSLSPLGAAILRRNTQALISLTDALQDFSTLEPSTVVVTALRGSGEPLKLDAWTLCGHVGLEMPLQPLTEAFNLDDDTAHPARLGVALEHALVERLGQIHQADALSKEARHLAQTFLVLGAEPSHERLQKRGIDPAWVVGIVCTETAPEYLASLKTLIRLKFPLDPTHPMVEAPIHLAAQIDNAPAIIELLDGGADAHFKDASGRTLEQALHEDSRTAIIDLLRIWTARKFALDAMGLFDAYSIPVNRKSGPR